MPVQIENLPRILGLDKQIILVGEDPDHLRESQLRLARVGIENPRAYLEDGITGWTSGGYELDYIPQISLQEFSDLLSKEKSHIAILDVRERGEVESGAMEGSVRIPPGQLQGRTAQLERNKLLVVQVDTEAQSPPVSFVAPASATSPTPPAVITLRRR